MANALEPFDLNGSKTTGSCTPPFKSLESVASDKFSVRFDDGFETWPRIEIWDPGPTVAARGKEEKGHTFKLNGSVS